MEKEFDLSKNHIGNNKLCYFFTDPIYKRCKILNKCAECHDIHYSNLYYKMSWWNRIFLKIMYDLIFLIWGVNRAIITFRFWEVIPILICYIVLLLTTPFPKMWSN